MSLAHQPKPVALALVVSSGATIRATPDRVRLWQIGPKTPSLQLEHQAIVLEHDPMPESAALAVQHVPEPSDIRG